MFDTTRPSSRLAPASVYLLAEHLDAALAAGEDLTSVLYIWPGEPPREAPGIKALRSGRREAIERIRALELGLVARVLMARELSAGIALEHEQLMPIGRLFVSGTAVLVDAVAECADFTEADFDTGDDLTAYVRARGLIAEDAPALSDTSPIAANENFLVARRIPLGVLLDLVAAFLDSLESVFDLFSQDEQGGEPALSLPAPSP